MKVLALVTDAFGAPGGVAQYNRDLLAAIGAMANVVVLPRHGRHTESKPSAGITQAPARTGRLAYSVSALRLAASFKPDVIFCGHLFHSPLAALLSRTFPTSLVVQAHGIEAWPAPKEIIRRSVASADLVLSVSRYTRQQILAWSRLPPERLVVLPNTVREEFTPGDKAAARAMLRLGPERTILSVGRLDARERYKGHDRVIEALAQLKAEGFDITYLVAGDGSDRHRLAGLASAAGVADRVRFLGDVPAELLPGLYRACDLFVLPSTGEGFGIVFLEAMACGVPALGLGVGGARDALADGELGIMSSPDRLAADLRAALSSERPGTSDGRSMAVAERFGRDRFAERARAIFSRLPAWSRSPTTLVAATSGIPRAGTSGA